MKLKRLGKSSRSITHAHATLHPNNGLGTLSTLFAFDIRRRDTGVPLTEDDVPAIAGPFKLVDQNGRRVTNLDFNDLPLAVFFGLMLCPDVCPTTLNHLTTMMADLGTATDTLQVLFVSIDHERDTPDELKDCMTSFDPGILALSGTPAEIVAATRKPAA